MAVFSIFQKLLELSTKFTWFPQVCKILFYRNWSSYSLKHSYVSQRLPSSDMNIHRFYRAKQGSHNVKYLLEFTIFSISSPKDIEEQRNADVWKEKQKGNARHVLGNKANYEAGKISKIWAAG